MIYGLIPVGGKGKRLSLPFSKEMLPQKGYNYYNPILNHLVEKMIKAGAGEIYFIHGDTYKEDIVSYFKENKHKHILQEKIGFAMVLKTFYDNLEKKLDKNDQILFGLPDVYFEGNPFPCLLEEYGLVCGLFKTNDFTKVDRLIINTNKFDVKSIKTYNNSDYFWGVLKFDKENLDFIIQNTNFETTQEIGHILNNSIDKKFCYYGKYIDIGTWENLNIYWSNSEI